MDMGPKTLYYRVHLRDLFGNFDNSSINVLKLFLLTFELVYLIFLFIRDIPEANHMGVHVIFLSLSQSLNYF